MHNRRVRAIRGTVFPVRARRRRCARPAWRLAVILLLLPAGLLAAAAGAAPQGAVVVVCEVDGAISPVTAEFIIESLQTAQQDGADLFLLRLNTPGGLDLAMRDIIQAFLASPVPTGVWVAPAGARAASAGFMIALAADVVAMASGTNTGASTPVSVGGGEIDETMQRKIIQDAEAYARSLAERRGRPVDAAVAAVSEGRSFAASEAIELGLADVIADDLDEVLTLLSGHVARPGADDELTFDLEGAQIVELQMSLRQQVLATLANPQIAYFLLLLAAGGLYFELSNPGAVLPGVVGAVSLVLALLAFQQLPFSYAGLALLGLGIVFLVLELKVVSYGLLTLAGLVSFVLGSMLLFRGPVPEMRLSLSFVLPVALAFMGLMAAMLQLVVRAHQGRVLTGGAGLITEVGRATVDFDSAGNGQVFVHGELWRAHSDQTVKKEDTVEVVDIHSGLRIEVRLREASPPSPLASQPRS